MLEKKLEKINSIENLRGIAALMVMLCHIGSLNHHLNLSFTINLQLGVQLFFAISGFIIPYSMYKLNYKISNFGKFMVRRMFRIEPPYLISILLTLFFFHWLTPNNIHFTWVDILLHIGYLIPFFLSAQWISHVYWTLAIEYQFYLIMGLIFPLLILYNKYVSVVLCFLLLFFTYIQFPMLKDSEMIYHHLHHFSIGIFTFLFVIKRINKKDYILGLILYFILGKLMISYTHATISILSSLSILFLTKKNYFGTFFGSISYSLYITHSITLFIIAESMKFIFSLTVPAINILALILVSFLCIGVAYLFYLLFELPFLRISKKIKY